MGRPSRQGISHRHSGWPLLSGTGDLFRPRSSRSEDLAPAQEGSVDTNILEPVEIAGQRIVIEHDHVGDLADLERSVSVLVPGQPVAALHRQPQRLLAAEVTVSELPL